MTQTTIEWRGQEFCRESAAAALRVILRFALPVPRTAVAASRTGSAIPAAGGPSAAGARTGRSDPLGGRRDVVAAAAAAASAAGAAS